MATCHTCGSRYDRAPDQQPWSWCEHLGFYLHGHNTYGWHPSFGECYFCFCFAMFGGSLEPKEVTVKEIYTIDPNKAMLHWNGS